jgi:hypothetical protein
VSEVQSCSFENVNLLQFVDLSTGKVGSFCVLDHDVEIKRIWFCDDGRTVCTLSATDSIALFDRRSGRTLMTLASDTPLSDLAVHPSEPWAVAAGDAGCMLLDWRGGLRAAVRTAGPAEPVRTAAAGALSSGTDAAVQTRCVRISGRRVAHTAEAGHIGLWDAAAPHECRTAQVCRYRPASVLA